MRGILAETRENVPETSQFHVSVNVIGCNYCGNTSLRVGNWCFQVISIVKKAQVSFVRLGLIYMECSVRSARSFLLYVSNSFTIMVFDVEFMLSFQVLHSPKYILRQCNAETSLRTRFTSLEMW